MRKNKMYATVGGVYENTPTQNRMNVWVVFMDESHLLTTENSHADKLAQLQANQHDLLFMSDLQTVNDDFAYIDNEAW